MISETTRQKMRESALKRDNSNRIASLPRGEKHWHHSEEPNILTMHKRLHRKFGKASDHLCVENCGRQAVDWSLNGDIYTDSIEDYSPRCRSCHIRKDDKGNDRALKVSLGLKRAYAEGRRKPNGKGVGGRYPKGSTGNA